MKIKCEKCGFVPSDLESKFCSKCGGRIIQVHDNDDVDVAALTNANNLDEIFKETQNNKQAKEPKASESIDANEPGNFNEVNSAKTIEEDFADESFEDDKDEIHEDENKSLESSNINPFVERSKRLKKAAYYVSADPYYRDVLPEVNNERYVFNRDMVVKIIVAFLGAVFIMGLMIWVMS